MAEINQDKLKALETAVCQIEKQFGKGAIMRLGEQEAVSGQRHSDRLARAGPGARRRRRAARPRDRDLRPGVVGQDHAGAARHRQARRRPAGSRRSSTPSTRSTPTTAPKLGVDIDNLLRRPAGHRRGGAGDRRDAGPLGRGGRDRDRLGGGPGAARRARGRDGRLARRPAGPADVPGDAQAHRHRLEVEDLRDLHQPDPREDRRDVRQPRDHARRPGAQVLRLGAHRHPAHRPRSRRARSAVGNRTRSRW